MAVIWKRGRVATKSECGYSSVEGKSPFFGNVLNHDLHLSAAHHALFFSNVIAHVDGHAALCARANDAVRIHKYRIFTTAAADSSCHAECLIDSHHGAGFHRRGALCLDNGQQSFRGRILRQKLQQGEINILGSQRRASGVALR